MSDDTLAEISTDTRSTYQPICGRMSIDTRPTLDDMLTDMLADSVGDTRSSGSYNRHDLSFPR